jgi:hypothetical protein
MTLPQLLALAPQIQAAFAAQGVTITLPQMLALYPAVEALVKNPTPAPTPAAPTIPPTLTIGGDANNAPYGVTLAGFSPQDHQGANLRDQTNAKYVVYAYLAANQIPPSKSWASAAVPVLSAAVPTVPWQAADGETLVYGDEYVHTAPNGYGMAPGTWNPDMAPLEFFWGAFGG